MHHSKSGGQCLSWSKACGSASVQGAVPYIRSTPVSRPSRPALRRLFSATSKAAVSRCSKILLYSMTSSARPSSGSGTMMATVRATCGCLCRGVAEHSDFALQPVLVELLEKSGRVGDSRGSNQCRYLPRCTACQRGGTHIVPNRRRYPRPMSEATTKRMQQNQQHGYVEHAVSER